MNRVRLFCGFCKSSKESPNTGPLLNKDDVVAHRNCLFFSSNIVNENTPDDDDLLGFQLKDVKEEIKRGSRLKCAKCRKSGATVGCEVKRCTKSYHYPCALDDGAQNIEDVDKGIFKIYCRFHKEGSDTKKDDSDENDNVVKRKRPRLSIGSGTRRIVDNDSSDSDESNNEADPEQALLETDLEDSRDLRENSPILDEHGRDMTEPQPSTSGAFQCKGAKSTAKPSAAQVNKTDGPDRPRRSEQAELTTKNQESKDQVQPNSGTENETDIDSDQESTSLLVPLKITQVVSVNLENLASVNSSGSGAWSSSGEAAHFWRKCREAGCVETIFRTFISAMNGISERILSEQASEEDCALALRVLEASRMLPEIFAQKDREYEERFLNLQQEMEAVKKSQSAARSAAKMKRLK
ncbi:hypothetical protein SKAU_G00254770 [Synaphobranchus kaupii]|uniref:PHD-type domain-containing protein n=1 Tax=Synaphobranchus kaupii TaxID=118154 RepID=A0A9Q1IS94_SYNKA|nr:hypothetical protein SKAU_G00254770 [Synaphobranchus kaupii]